MLPVQNTGARSIRSFSAPWSVEETALNALIETDRVAVLSGSPDRSLCQLTADAHTISIAARPAR